MHIKEYVALRIARLTYMRLQFEGYNKSDPDGWPLDMSEEEWVEQDLVWESTAESPDVHPDRR